MILETIAKQTAIRVDTARNHLPFDEIKKRAQKKGRGSFCFEKALKQRGLSFICEVKKASPSIGLIAKSFPYVKIAKAYERAGAAAVSVITEPEFFLGNNVHLTDIKSAVSLPLLRKDFTVDAYQIYESHWLGADAVLLICALLDTDKLKDFLAICDELGISALVEAHTAAEVKAALEAGARIIGINNRDLKTFEVNINTCLSLRKLVPDDKIFVAESGIKSPEDIELLRTANTNAVLIGEALMRSKNIGAELEKLREGAAK